ncbi:MAG: glycosyltransferase family 39 protein [Bacteroidota bacterium]
MKRPADIVPIVILLLGWVAGMFVDIMEVDAGQYASMSLEMLKSSDFLHLRDRGVDYLDKPPLIFWLTTLSFKAFGVGTFAYKLPSVLLAMLAVWSTGRLGAFLYDRRTGYYAALIQASCQAMFLMNNDVKTDMYMIGPMAFALWQLVVFARGGKWWHLQLGFVGLAIAMLGKGPIGVVAPALAMGADFVLRRDWKGLFRRPWLLGLPVFALLLLPFCLGLHEQFGWKGVKFFLWTQSFGRITGASEWQNDASPFFFVHTYAWSFLPWTLVLLPAIGRKIRDIFRRGFRLSATEEGLSLGGFVLLFIALSTSRFKLPHYIFVTYPFAALLCAAYLKSLIEQSPRRWERTFFFGQNLLLVVLTGIVAGTLAVWAFPQVSLLLTLVFALGWAAVLFSYFRFPTAEYRLVVFLVVGFAWVNFFVNAGLYPQLLTFQSTGKAGQYIRENDIPADRLYAYDEGGRALDFYGGGVAQQVNHVEEFGTVFPKPAYLYTTEKGRTVFTNSPHRVTLLKTFPHFRVGNLKLKFINPATRPEKVSPRYLLRID